ncbi:MAG: hypothetical protein HY323_18545 [Betaproteobacteria bacterium]|nr:hypothetical protein [Betaproteobacteria bacterium]
MNVVEEPTDSLRGVQATDSLEDEASESFRAYLEYNRVLRTWFVAFGVGGPALFLVNEQIATRLAEAQRFRLVVILFLAGAAAQVLGALLNKVANWYVYHATIDTKRLDTCRYRVADWFVNCFWPDIVLDVWTISAFGYAGWLLLNVFA